MTEGRTRGSRTLSIDTINPLVVHLEQEKSLKGHENASGAHARSRKRRGAGTLGLHQSSNMMETLRPHHFEIIYDAYICYIRDIDDIYIYIFLI